MKLSHHILLSLLATLTVRANAQPKTAVGLEIAAAGSESSGEDDDWGTPNKKASKRPAPVQAAPVQAAPVPSETVQTVSSPDAPSETDQVPSTDEDYDEAEEAKPAPVKKTIPKKLAPKAAPVDAPAATSTTQAAAVNTPAQGAATAPPASSLPSLPPQQAPQNPKPALPESAIEAVPAPATKAPIVKNPVRPAAPVQAPAAPSNGAAQQAAPAQVMPKQVPAGVPLSPNTAVNPENAAAVGNPMLPAKDIPLSDSTDDLRGDPNTSTSASRAKAKVKIKSSDVGLSSDQTSAIIEIRKAAQNSIEKRLTEELKTAKQDLNTSMVDATPAQEVRKKFDLVQKKYLDLQRIKFERTLKIREVLSVEQRKKMQGIKTSH